MRSTSSRRVLNRRWRSKNRCWNPAEFKSLRKRSSWGRMWLKWTRWSSRWCNMRPWSKRKAKSSRDNSSSRSTSKPSSSRSESKAYCNSPRSLHKLNPSRNSNLKTMSSHISWILRSIRSKSRSRIWLMKLKLSRLSSRSYPSSLLKKRRRFLAWKRRLSPWMGILKSTKLNMLTYKRTKTCLKMNYNILLTISSN